MKLALEYLENSDCCEGTSTLRIPLLYNNRASFHLLQAQLAVEDGDTAVARNCIHDATTEVIRGLERGEVPALYMTNAEIKALLYYLDYRQLDSDQMKESAKEIEDLVQTAVRLKISLNRRNRDSFPTFRQLETVDSNLAGRIYAQLGI